MKYNIGEIFTTKDSLGCYDFIIEAYLKSGWRRIKFLDSNYIVDVHISAIKRGEIKNPFHPSLLGVGFIGVGEAIVSEHGKLTTAYKEWVSMIKRVYNPTKKSESYKNVSVCKDWHNFNKFFTWHILNYKEGYELDKDVLQYNQEKKIYSPKTCLYIPSHINTYLRCLKSSNTSGCTNVNFNKKRNRWIVRHTNFYTRKREYIKSFENKEDAIKCAKGVMYEDYLIILKNIRNE